MELLIGLPERSNKCPGVMWIEGPSAANFVNMVCNIMVISPEIYRAVQSLARTDHAESVDILCI